MLQIKCTGKVQTFLKLKPADMQPIAPSDTLLGDWYVNLLLIDRRKTLLFVNEKTASSFVLFGLKVRHIPDIHIMFLTGLNGFLRLQGVPAGAADAILSSYQDVSFTKTDSKQSLGIMNDLAFHYEHSIWYEHGYKYCDLDEIILRNNRIPFKCFDYGQPITLLQGVVARL